uniref:Uncharacterized protein n=1 Tax=Arundo donax TaxID=35708 RepID=A0A0A9A901_ARUDO
MNLNVHGTSTAHVTEGYTTKKNRLWIAITKSFPVCETLTLAVTQTYVLAKIKRYKTMDTHIIPKEISVG